MRRSKRKTLDSGGQPGTEKPERKREKCTTSSFDASDTVMAEKSEECIAPLDQSQEGDKGTAGDNVARKKNKQRRQRSLRADKQEGELVVESAEGSITTGMDPVVVEEAPVAAKGRESQPGTEKPERKREKCITSSLDASDTVMAEKSEECVVPLDQSQEGDKGTAGDHVARKKNKQRRHRSDKQEVELVVECAEESITTGMDPVVVEEAPVVAKGRESQPGTEKPERKRENCIASSLDASETVMAEKSEECVASLDQSQEGDKGTAGDHVVRKKNKHRRHRSDKQKGELVVECAEESITTGMDPVVVEDTPVVAKGGESQPGMEKPEMKREKCTASGVDASDTVMAEKSEECVAPLDQSQEGDKGTTGDHVVRKKNKQRRHRSDKQEGELVVECAEESITTGMNPGVVEEAPVVAKGRESQPGMEKPERKREKCTASSLDASDTVMAEKSEECVATLDQSQEGDKRMAGDHVVREKNKHRRHRSDKQEGELVVECAEESITTSMDPVVVEDTPVVAKGGESQPGTEKPEMKREKCTASGVDASDTVMAEKSEECIAPLDQPQKGAKGIAGDHVARKKNKQRRHRSDKQEGELVVECAEESITTGMNPVVVEEAPDVAKGRESQPGMEKPERKREKCTASSLDASDTVMAEKSEECVATLDQSQEGDKRMAGDHVVREKNKHRRHRSDKQEGELVVECAEESITTSMDPVVVEDTPVVAKGGESQPGTEKPEMKREKCTASGVDASDTVMAEKSEECIVPLDQPQKGAKGIAGDHVARKKNKQRRQRSDKQEGELVVESAEESFTAGMDPVVVEEAPDVAKDGDSYPKKNRMKSEICWVLPDVKKDTAVTEEKQTQKGESSSRRSSKSLAKNAAEFPSRVDQKDANFSSSSLNTTHVVSVDKNDSEVSNSDSLVLTDKEEVVVRTDAEKGGMPPDTNLYSNEEKEQEKKRKKKKKNPCTDSIACTSIDATCADSSSMPEVVEVGLVKKTPDETPVIINLVSPVKNENTVVVGIDNNETDVLESNKGSSLPVHPKAHKKKKKKDRDSGLTQIAAANSPNVSGTSGEMTIGSFQSEDPSSSQPMTTDKNLNGGLCPSPIRGVVQDLGSADVSNKQSSQLDSFKADEVSFSFPIAGKVFEYESSESQPEKACKSGGVFASGNGSTTAYNESSNGRRVNEVSSSSPPSLDVCGSEGKELEVVPVRLDGRLIRSTRKKLLVLDLNGILADIINDYRLLRNVRKPHKKVGGKSVFKRPFCDDFLNFCFERFEIGIWSSRKKYNVADVVEYLMGDTKHKLLFSWDQSRCTVTGFRTIENMHKPLVLKELKKLWNKEEPDLPWEKGDYSPSNTLLVDDSPYKALCNPPHTAIFPRPYLFNDENDNSLGPGGDIRVYLEGVALADDVQLYVQEHPFGQNAITATNPSWKFYQQVIESAST